MRCRSHRARGRRWVGAVDALVDFLRVTNSLPVRDPYWFTESVPLLQTLVNFWNFYKARPKLPSSMNPYKSHTFFNLLMKRSKLQAVMELLYHAPEILDPNYISPRCGCTGDSCPRTRQLRFVVCLRVEKADILSVIEARHLLHEALCRENFIPSPHSRSRYKQGSSRKRACTSKVLICSQKSLRRTPPPCYDHR